MGVFGFRVAVQLGFSFQFNGPSMDPTGCSILAGVRTQVSSDFPPQLGPQLLKRLAETLCCTKELYIP